ncbi:Thioesterase super member 4 [Phlyctochytrium bullatum]|nr:Thioesterase super member 4 [Phlyctochytrium bullatum]
MTASSSSPHRAVMDTSRTIALVVGSVVAGTAFGLALAPYFRVTSSSLSSLVFGRKKDDSGETEALLSAAAAKPYVPPKELVDVVESLPVVQRLKSIVPPLEHVTFRPLLTDLIKDDRVNKTSRAEDPAAFTDQFIRGRTLYGPGRIEYSFGMLSREEKTMVKVCKLGSSICGHKGLVHGGMISALFDDFFGAIFFANAEQEYSGFTANLSIDYRFPVPAPSTVVFICWIERIDGRKVFLRGEMRSAEAYPSKNGAVHPSAVAASAGERWGEPGSIKFADATSLYIIPKDQYERPEQPIPTEDNSIPTPVANDDDLLVTVFTGEVGGAGNETVVTRQLPQPVGDAMGNAAQLPKAVDGILLPGAENQTTGTLPSDVIAAMAGFARPRVLNGTNVRAHLDNFMFFWGGLAYNARKGLRGTFGLPDGLIPPEGGVDGAAAVRLYSTMTSALISASQLPNATQTVMTLIKANIRAEALNVPITANLDLDGLNTALNGNYTLPLLNATEWVPQETSPNGNLTKSLTLLSANLEAVVQYSLNQRDAVAFMPVDTLRSQATELESRLSSLRASFVAPRSTGSGSTVTFSLRPDLLSFRASSLDAVATTLQSARSAVITANYAGTVTVMLSGGQIDEYFRNAESIAVLWDPVEAVSQAMKARAEAFAGVALVDFSDDLEFKANISRIVMEATFGNASEYVRNLFERGDAQGLSKALPATAGDICALPQASEATPNVTALMRTPYAYAPKFFHYRKQDCMDVDGGLVKFGADVGIVHPDLGNVSASLGPMVNDFRFDLLSGLLAGYEVPTDLKTNRFYYYFYRPPASEILSEDAKVLYGDPFTPRIQALRAFPARTTVAPFVTLDFRPSATSVNQIVSDLASYFAVSSVSASNLPCPLVQAADGRSVITWGDVRQTSFVQALNTALTAGNDLSGTVSNVSTSLDVIRSSQNNITNGFDIIASLASSIPDSYDGVQKIVENFSDAASTNLTRSIEAVRARIISQIGIGQQALEAFLPCKPLALDSQVYEQYLCGSVVKIGPSAETVTQKARSVAPDNLNETGYNIEDVPDYNWNETPQRWRNWDQTRTQEEETLYQDRGWNLEAYKSPYGDTMWTGEPQMPDQAGYIPYSQTWPSPSAEPQYPETWNWEASAGAAVMSPGFTDTPNYGTEQADYAEDTLSVSSEDLDNPAELERKIFTAINEGNRDALQNIFSKFPSSTEILSLLLTTTYPNTEGTYHHDPEVLSDACELLGDSLEHLNGIQIACILGDEEIASDILEFVYRVTEEIEARKVLYEFMGRVWGNGNTVLHLASFLGMSDLVKRLIELGANPNKKNERNYKPVDCADDDLTRNIEACALPAPDELENRRP